MHILDPGDNVVGGNLQINPDNSSDLYKGFMRPKVICLLSTISHSWETFFIKMRPFSLSHWISYLNDPPPPACDTKFITFDSIVYYISIVCNIWQTVV